MINLFFFKSCRNIIKIQIFAQGIKKSARELKRKGEFKAEF